MKRTMKPLMIIFSVLFLTLFASATRAENVELYLHIGTSSNNFLSEMDLPTGVSSEITFVKGLSQSWETFLTGDISGNVYSFSLDLASDGQSTFKAELIVNRAAVRKVIATTDFVVSSPFFKRFNREVKGKASATRGMRTIRVKFPLWSGSPLILTFSSSEMSALLESKHSPTIAKPQ